MCLRCLLVFSYRRGHNGDDHDVDHDDDDNGDGVLVMIGKIIVLVSVKCITSSMMKMLSIPLKLSHCKKHIFFINRGHVLVLF